jgi:hypothetical protein
MPVSVPCVQEALDAFVKVRGAPEDIAADRPQWTIANQLST